MESYIDEILNKVLIQAKNDFKMKLLNSPLHIYNESWCDGFHTEIDISFNPEWSLPNFVIYLTEKVSELEHRYLWEHPFSWVWEIQHFTPSSLEIVVKWELNNPFDRLI